MIWINAVRIGKNFTSLQGGGRLAVATELTGTMGRAPMSGKAGRAEE